MVLESLRQRPLVVAQVVAATAGIGALIAYNQLSPSLKLRIIAADRAPDSFRNSRTVTHIVNPRNFAFVDDSVTAVLELPAEQRTISDETVLAQFIKGFFGGRVIQPERTLFWTFRPKFTDFSTIDASTAPKPVWYPSELSDTALPPLHTVVFGGFQVGNIELQQPHDGTIPGFKTESNADFVFGSDKAQFSGVHRFSVLRQGEEVKPGEKEKICVRLSSMSCNPSVDKPLSPLLFAFHKVYENLLFREGVSEVMRWLSKLG